MEDSLSTLRPATLLLRAAIPDGYMPAPVGNGLPFVLCPSAVPAEFMVLLTGSEHHHHHGAEGATDSGVEASQCPIGHMLTPAIAAGDNWQPTTLPPPFVFAALPSAQYSSTTPLTSRSRGPPA